MSVVALDFDLCYRATESRDARFDGWFIVGVRTTGVYCRPSCPSPVLPKADNITFFRTAAAAQLAGLRACKRCRPDAVPGSPEWDTRADLVGRAMRLIADGVVDRAGVPGLAGELAVSERHLHRLLLEGVGAPPLALARAQRAQTARMLIETTPLSFSEIAFAAGFSSIRQFNETIRQIFARAVSGVEEVLEGIYRRTLRLPSGIGIVALKPHEDHVRATFRLGNVADLGAAVYRCRRLLDLDVDPHSHASVLAADEVLAPLIAANPGMRAPGAVDGAESAIRAVLGQVVSLAAAQTVSARLVVAHGSPLEEPDGSLTHAFPTPDALAAAALDGVGLPRTRRETLRELAHRLAGGALRLDGGADRNEVQRRLLEIPGVGTWTATYISLRALGDPDAFPASDLGLRRAARKLRLPGSAAALTARSQRWRPWRAYAAHHLWAVDA